MIRTLALLCVLSLSLPAYGQYPGAAPITGTNTAKPTYSTGTDGWQRRTYEGTCSLSLFLRIGDKVAPPPGSWKRMFESFTYDYHNHGTIKWIVVDRHP